MHFASARTPLRARARAHRAINVRLRRIISRYNTRFARAWRLINAHVILANDVSADRDESVVKR